MSEIYLDHSATTQPRTEVVEAMLPFMEASFGNPSSIHYYGQAAKAAIDNARDIIASSIGAEPSEITFTGSGTESDNLALVGTLLASPPERNRLIVSAIEHEAVLKSAEFAEKLGYRATIVGVDSEGVVPPVAVSESLSSDVALVSVMHGNNEVGSIQNISEIANYTRAAGALMHTDSVQTFGQLPVNVDHLDVNLLTVSAHKIYGPKGVGALYIQRGTPIAPLVYGGGQERGRRSGTENVPGIVGFGKAVELMLAERDDNAKRMSLLRDHFIAAILSEVPTCSLNGPAGDLRLPNNINLTFDNIEGEALLLNLDIAGIAASSGSACASGSIEPSHVLIAMGIDTSKNRGAIRLTLGRNTTSDEMETCLQVLKATVLRLREMSANSLKR